MRGLVAALTLTLSTVGGCGADGQDQGEAGDGDDGDTPFEPHSPQAALHKVKTFLVGHAPTDAEYQAYADDPDVLPDLIDEWMELPEFEVHAKEMFEFLFQQRAGSDEIGLMLREQNTDIFQQREGRGGVDLETPMRKGFAMTAWDIVAEGRPFTEVATTRTFYMNVPLMMAMAYIDATPRDDANQYVEGHSWLESQHPDLVVRYTQTETIPYQDSIDPNHANYGLFSIGTPDGSSAGTSACDGLADSFAGRAGLEEVYKYVMGAPFRTTCWSWNGAQANQFKQEGDLAYRKVTVRLAVDDEPRTSFFDLDALRTTDELVLDTEYLGYFGTLGFLTQWTTNDANEHRVTANQTLIVGLGVSFDPGASNISIDDVQADELHAEPGTPCYGCHQVLDPLRDFFRQSYTYWGTKRIDGMGANEDIPAEAFFTLGQGGPQPGVGVSDLATFIATSDRFAPAWTLKMCELVNAGMCTPNDEELERIAEVFEASGFDFKVLMRELLSSPVVTYQQVTDSWRLRGPAIGTALQDDFCRRLETRLGIADACALRDELAAPAGERDIIQGYAGVMAAIGYPRGAVAPQQPIVPTLFSTAGVESLCEALADRFFDGGGGDDLFGPDQRDEAMEFFLTEVMGYWTRDPRSAALRDVLDAHWDAVVEHGGDAQTALASTFVLACSAPQTSAIGL